MVAVRPPVDRHGAGGAQVVNTEIAGAVTWRLFDAGSATAVRAAAGLDRHWRNARTVSSHNPAAYKASLLGDYTVNGAAPRSFLNSLAAERARAERT
ncbi:hypothetical protein [Nocardia sp. CA-290969]|uniref:hypothetical protein n=1 Tax=Nocardia sp. CA-290969 TaxID=3239986 RepID=UPI003D89F741